MKTLAEIRGLLEMNKTPDYNKMSISELKKLADQKLEEYHAVAEILKEKQKKSRTKRLKGKPDPRDDMSNYREKGRSREYITPRHLEGEMPG